MELVQLVTPQDTYQAMISTMTTQMMASLSQSGAKMPADAANKMGKAVMEALPYNDLAQWTVEIYASRFTTDEIKQMIAFYKTPVGKKAAKLLPEISGEIGKKMGPIVMQRLPAAMKKATSLKLGSGKNFQRSALVAMSRTTPAPPARSAA